MTSSTSQTHSRTPRRVAYLFFTLLVLLILFQALVLDWGAEGVFFVTWFFAALVVQHDSRLSAAVGLVFLAVVPFLLIAQKDGAADLAANYAYFFLVIGVLIQLEELLLERLGWLQYKLDLSYLAGGLSWLSDALPSNSLLRGILLLLVLPLAALLMVGLYNLTTTERMARMEVVFDFIAHREQAQRTSPIPEGEVVEVREWRIEDQPRRVLYHHPAFSGLSRVAYQVHVEDGTVLAFDLALDPESWELSGDGVTFSVYVDLGQGAEQLFSTYIDPKRDPDDRRWHPHTVPLDDYAGQTVTLIFETGVGPAGDERYDWAGWGNLRLESPAWP